MQSSIERKVTDLAEKLAMRSYLLAFGLGVVFAMLGFQYLQTRLGAPMLDVMSAYDREGLVERLLLFGETGRAMHARFTLFLDMVFPFIYGGFLAGLVHLLTRGTRFQKSLFAVPVVMLIDWVENAQILALLWGFPDLSDGQIAAASATTQAKTLALQLVFLGLAGLLMWQVLRRVTGPKA